MHVIHAKNINEATNLGIKYILEHGIEEDSRNGRVLVAPHPVCTVYYKPQQRVLFSPTRDANPFFHLMEALWMLSGRNDIAWPARFNQKFFDYSDDGVTQFGAYGYRWKNFFGYDQLEKIIHELRKNPNSRRCVLAMWNAFELDEYEDDDAPLLSHCDLYVATHGGKDVPCNTHAYFDCRNGKLNMTVCNRSNDIVWGAYGANVVHFSILQEYMASKLEIPVGIYRQVSNNFHAYTDIYSREKLWHIAEEAAVTDFYLTDPNMIVVPLIGETTNFDEKLKRFLDEEKYSGTSMFLEFVAEPMLKAHTHTRKKEYEAAWQALNIMPNCDWKKASKRWIIKRTGGDVNGA